MPWNPEKARQFLTDAAHERAKGPGLSDTSLGRLAALQDEEGAASKAAFVRALQRAGWRPRRINKAVTVVMGEKRPRPSWWRLWTQRWMFSPREDVPSYALIIAGVSMLLLSLSALIAVVFAHPLGTALIFLAVAIVLWNRERKKKAVRVRIETFKASVPKRVALAEEDEEDIPPITGRARRRH